jgi:splicing factor 3A subunit 1
VRYDIYLLLADIKPKAAVAKPENVAPAPVVKPIPKEPKALSFLIDTPPIPSIDYEMIKLTALFVARNGRNFMNNLAKKEARNFQFDFLKSNHALFGYFTRLVEMYSKLLNPKKDMLRDLERFMESKFNALEDIYGRVAYQRHQEETSRKEKERVEEERGKYCFIMEKLLLLV